MPGDDHGNDGGAVVPVPSGTQSFSSVGGSITVAVNGSSISLASNSPAAGFGAEVHDNGPSRVEVRFTERRHRVAHPGRARQRRSHVGDHPARVIAARVPAQPPARGVSSVDGSSRYATTCQRPLRRAISTRLCTTVPVAELDRGDRHRRVARRSPPGRRRRARRVPPSACCCSYADRLAATNPRRSSPSRSSVAREREQRLEVEAVPRQLVGHRDLAGPGPAVLGDHDDHRERQRQDDDPDDGDDHVRQPSISVARSKSWSVRPPASWVESATRTLR